MSDYPWQPNKRRAKPTAKPVLPTSAPSAQPKPRAAVLTTADLLARLQAHLEAKGLAGALIAARAIPDGTIGIQARGPRAWELYLETGRFLSHAAGDRP